MVENPGPRQDVRELFGPLGHAWECIVGAQELVERATDALQRNGGPAGLLAWAKLSEDVLAQLRTNVERERTRGGEGGPVPQGDGDAGGVL